MLTDKFPPSAVSPLAVELANRIADSVAHNNQSSRDAVMIEDMRREIREKAPAIIQEALLREKGRAPDPPVEAAEPLLDGKPLIDHSPPTPEDIRRGQEVAAAQPPPPQPKDWVEAVAIATGQQIHDVGCWSAESNAKILRPLLEKHAPKPPSAAKIAEVVIKQLSGITMPAYMKQTLTNRIQRVLDGEK